MEVYFKKKRNNVAEKNSYDVNYKDQLCKRTKPSPNPAKLPISSQDEAKIRQRSIKDPEKIKPKST
jgi:hypothetical protein